MKTAKHIGRFGALAVTVGVAAAAVPPPEPSEVKLAAESTVLALCGTTCPKWRDADLDLVIDQFIAPGRPGDTFKPVAVTVPNEFWPVTGILRVLEWAVGDPRLAGPGGGAWPNEPWWKLSGLFDFTANQSLKAGAADLEVAIADNPSDHQVIYGYSQGAGVANVVKRRLAEQYPGPGAPDIDFVLGGDPNMPNGGLMSRFPGLYIPILDLLFNGPERTDTQFDTVAINRKYDGFGDFPLYPLNLVATVNALLGAVYVHTWPFDVSLPSPNPTTSPAYQGHHGDTDYYLFDTQDLPLFGPLRSLGVPEKLIDVVEPFFRVLVELGYDRSIPVWKPTPARLIPRIDLVKVVRDLVTAVGEGINNALAVVGLPPAKKVPSVVAPVPESANSVGAESVSPTSAKSVRKSSTTATTAEPDVSSLDDRPDDSTLPKRNSGTTKPASSVASPDEASEPSSADGPVTKPVKKKRGGEQTRTRAVRDALGVTPRQSPGGLHRDKGDRPTAATTEADASPADGTEDAAA